MRQTRTALKTYKILLALLIAALCGLLTVAAVINYREGGASPGFDRSPIPEIGHGLYQTGMSYVVSLQSDVFTQDVLYALEKQDNEAYNQMANSFMRKILALKTDSLSPEEITFVESVYFVCKAEYTARRTEYLAGLPLTGFLHKKTAQTDRANSDELYAMICGAKTMTDIQRVHDFGQDALDLVYFE